MKFLQILEKAWITAAISAVVVGLYFLITQTGKAHNIYVPFVCALFCGLIYHNIKSQRKFLEMKKREEDLMNKNQNQI